MSVRTVVRDDLLQLRRSWMGWGVGLALAGLAGIPAGLIGLAQLLIVPAGGSPLTTGAAVQFAAVFIALFMPMLAMLAGLSSLVRERETGRFRILLGLPNSRFDAFAGKFLSRAIWITLSTVAGFLLLALVSVLLLENTTEAGPILTIGEFLGFLGLSVAYGLLFLAVSVAFSAMFRSTTAVIGAIVATYMGLRILAMFLQFGILFAVRGSLAEASRPPFPEWYYLIGRANPLNAFFRLLTEILPIQGFLGDLFLTTPVEGTDTLLTGAPVAGLTMIGWLLVPLVLGYGVFRYRDLV
jgi:ABC-type transport system involved in multi-copper enzyme maturation permease subunit